MITLAAAPAVALVLGGQTQRLGLSTLAGYMAAGILVGPNTPGFVADQALASQLAGIGVVLLMFGVGMHLRPRELLRVWRIALRMARWSRWRCSSSRSAWRRWRPRCSMCRSRWVPSLPGWWSASRASGRRRRSRSSAHLLVLTDGALAERIRICQGVRALNPRLPIVGAASNDAEAAWLRDFGVDLVVDALDQQAEQVMRAVRARL